ncbi:MAG: hypothetical protein MHM6MM_001726 [Cercozoa sp. M6MM]
MFTRAAAIGRVQARLASNDAVILGYARTPIGRFQGGLSSVPATKLGETALSAAAEKAGVSMDEVQECYFGNVIAAGLGQAPARQVALGAGAQLSTPCTTVNKVCASGTKTVMLAAMAVQTGVADVVAAGGMESMSNIPYIMPQARKGFGYGHGQVVDALLADGLTDSFDKHHMGMCAEKCNKDHGITREQQDEYAKQSYTRAASAWDRGFFDDEIAPVSVPQRRGDPKVVSVDEEYTNVKFDKIGSLRPAFDKNGSVTAANASTLNDGAVCFLCPNTRTHTSTGRVGLYVNSVCPCAYCAGCAYCFLAKVRRREGFDAARHRACLRRRCCAAGGLPGGSGPCH